MGIGTVLRYAVLIRFRDAQTMGNLTTSMLAGRRSGIRAAEHRQQLHRGLIICSSGVRVGDRVVLGSLEAMSSIAAHDPAYRRQPQ